jgi:hypothetical protein
MQQNLGIILMIELVFIIFYAICGWKIFEKAGKPGWAAIIPIYNYIVLLEIVGKPWWWIFLLFIPFAGIVFAIMVIHQASLSFGKDSGFTLGLIFLGFIFIPILAFGDATYQGPGGRAPEVMQESY